MPFEGTPGPLNAITDVAGVLVGQTTLIDSSDPAHLVRTGVTAVLPRGQDSLSLPAFAGSVVLNGNGEMTGTAWVEESGMLEGPVVLTNTPGDVIQTNSFAAGTGQHKNKGGRGIRTVYVLAGDAAAPQLKVEPLDAPEPPLFMVRALAQPLPAFARTKASVANWVVLSPSVCVVAVVPLGSAVETLSVPEEN